MINIYKASEAREAADSFYGPLGQIFDYIRDNAKNGLYVLNVRGVELNSRQMEILSSAGYKVEQTLDAQDKIVYVVDWNA